MGLVKDGKVELKEKFLELRASGLSFQSCSETLGISKPTLISWSRELEIELRNSRALRLDELYQKFAVAKAKRIEVFGLRLQLILEELDRRDLGGVKTEFLLALALKYGGYLRDEHRPVSLQAEQTDAEATDFRIFKTWQG